MKILASILMTFFVFIAAYSAKAQPTIKTFKGELLSGKVVYTYYEDPTTGNYVRHGAYKYTDYKSEDGGIYSALFTGNYKNGFRDGIWKYVITEKDILYTTGSYKTGVLVLTISYKDGMPNGAWNYSDNSKFRDHISTRNGWIWGAYENSKPENVTANFKNGVVTGLFKLNSIFKSVSGQFDDRGFMTGKWIIKDLGVSQTDMEAMNGIVKRFTKVNIRSGNIMSKSSYSKELLQFHTQIPNLSSKEIEALCMERKIRIDTLATSELFKYEDFFEKDVFMRSDIGGDKTYAPDKGGFCTDTKNYGFYILVEPVDN